MTNKKHLLILYHSQTGNTKRMANAVLSGAQKCEEIEVKLLKAFDATLDDLLWCDGLIVGTPENFGYLSGGIKDFLDRTYYPARDDPSFVSRPYALFVSAGNDGTNAIRHFDRIVKGYPLVKVADPILCQGEVTEEALDRCKELGETIANGLAFGVY